MPQDWCFIPPADTEERSISVVSNGSLRALVRWQAAKRGVALRAILDAYLSRIASDAKRRKLTYSAKVTEGVRGLEYVWRADRKAHGLVWFCPVCNRTVIAEVSGTKDDPVLASANRIFATLTCHGGDGWSRWSAFGLVTAAPEGYRLNRPQFTSGRIEMRFARGAETIGVTRWGLAEFTLNKFALEDWAAGQGNWCDVIGHHETVDFRSHPVIVKSGTLRRWAWLKCLPQAIKACRLPANRVESAAWHCPETNRLYLVTWRSRGPADLTALLERTECCSNG